MQCEYERLNLVIKPYVPQGQTFQPQENAETRLMQETSCANVAKGKAQPEQLKVNWGDVEDSDTDNDADAQDEAENDSDDHDMDDGNDNHKRIGDDLPQDVPRDDRPQEPSKRAKIREPDTT
eukprot:3609568-Amphidinium_carterae.1